MMKAKKVLSVFTALVMLISGFALAANAENAEDAAGKVYISLEDFGDRSSLLEYCNEEDIAYPEPFGVIADVTEVPIYKGESVAEAVVAFLEMKNISHAYSGTTEPGGGFYLNDISFYWGDEYIESFGAGSITPGNESLYYNSGWMQTINNCFTSSGIADYEAADGDIIKIQYTCNMGADIGNDFSVRSAKITGIDLDKSYGTVSPAFGTDIKEYTLTLNEGVDAVKLAAQNENYSSVVTYTANGTEYKFMRDIPVQSGTVITVKSEFYASDPPEYVPYLFDEDEINITVVKSHLREDISAVFKAKLSHENFFNDDSVGSTACDWLALSLARFGAVNNDGEIKLLYNAPLSDYADAAEKYLRDLYEKNGISSSVKLTDYFRTAITLTALGRNVQDIIKAVTADNGAELNKMSVMTLAYGLIAIECSNMNNGKDSVHSPQEFVDALLSLQHEDGGWSLQSLPESDSDVDVTAVVLQALAPYCRDNNEAVVSASERALDFLSACQKSSGDFSSYGVFNAESTAQVLIALTELGIDFSSDPRFIKDGNTALDGLLLYQLSDGSFTHSLILDEENSSVAPGEYNYLATDQAAMALVSCWRQQKGLNSVYNMRPDPADISENLDAEIILSQNDKNKPSKGPGASGSATEKLKEFFSDAKNRKAVVSAALIIVIVVLVIVFVKDRKKKKQ